ncbi:DNA-formamidopyrimidine glycosylase [Candidatus Margulisiibacteriota bacterium]
MPELPEVQTIVSGLEPEIKGRKIIGFDLHCEKMLKLPLTKFKKAIINQKVISITRHGKYIFLNLENNFSIILHLRMTGQLLLKNLKASPDKHTHVVFRFQDKNIFFRDLRKFGTIELIKTTDITKYIENKKLAPDALSISFEKFQQNLSRKKTGLKAALLDQRVIAGIGNIYADEILFREKLSPKYPVPKLTSKKIKSLLKSIKTILQKGIELKGTSLSDYVDSNGNKGQNQHILKVHQQKGKPCPLCGTAIIREKVAGRGSFFCPNCQNISY